MIAAKNTTINASAAVGVVSGGMLISFTSASSSPSHPGIAVIHATGLCDSGHNQARHSHSTEATNF
jgi:hypothetical protein